MLELLSHHGAATATQLAARVGESSGATSYHLRQLEKYGFIEEDPGRGSGRERWWRRVPGGISLSTHELVDPAAKEAARLVVNEWNRNKQARLDHYRATFESWPTEWIDASMESSTHLRLTAAELQQLVDEVDVVLTRWHELSVERVDGRLDGDPADGGYADVEVQVNALPLGDPPSPPG